MARWSRVIGLSAAMIMTISTLLLSIPGGHGNRAAQDSGPGADVLAVNQPPFAVASANPTTIEVGGYVYFDAWASTDDDYVVGYIWNYTVDSHAVYFYGSYGAQVFNRTGSFIVTLTVMDSMGLSSADTVQINVTPPAGTYPPTAEAGQNTTASLYETIWFNSYMSWGSIIDYLWTFNVSGMPVRLWGREPQYTFDVLGTYVVTLTVTDWSGLTDSDEVTVRVVSVPWPGAAEAGPDQTVLVGEQVTFNGSGSQTYYEIVNYTWSFDEGTTAEMYGMTVTRTFWTPGDHIVWLKILDAQSIYMADITYVRVLASPNDPPHAEAGANATIESETVYRFNGSGSTDDVPGLSYVWNFRYNGTQEVLLGISATFPFIVPGKYTVTLTVSDAGGLSDSDIVIITVTEKSTATEFVEKYGVWLVIGGAEAALVALGALVVIKRRGTRKN